METKSKCTDCQSELKVVEYLEEYCKFFYRIACSECTDQKGLIIQVAKPLIAGSLCPNCLLGMMRQIPVKQRGLGLLCDSCNHFISFGYSIAGMDLNSLGLSA